MKGMYRGGHYLCEHSLDESRCCSRKRPDSIKCLERPMSQFSLLLEGEFGCGGGGHMSGGSTMRWLGEISWMRS